MTDYSQGKIYKIVCNVTNQVYIGSTVTSLERRLWSHKCCDKKEISSYQIIIHGDYYIELIEDYPCETKIELLKRERYYQDEIECVNTNRAYVTEEEVREQSRQQAKRYADNHIEILIARRVAYRLDHKDEMNDRRRAWRLDNEKNKETIRKYQEKNKDRLREYQRKRSNETKIECDNCGMMIPKKPSAVKRHKNTKTCMNF